MSHILQLKIMETYMQRPVEFQHLLFHTGLVPDICKSFVVKPIDILCDQLIHYVGIL